MDSGKGVNLEPADGDPVEVAAAYDRAGADELVFLDITASSDNRRTVVDIWCARWRRLFLFRLLWAAACVQWKISACFSGRRADKISGPLILQPLTIPVLSVTRRISSVANVVVAIDASRRR